ncbi:outer membrane lipoprotein LolB [Litorivivens lipolytica]|uniref:Outer-membrane lipoprotein LolB n=1 Tax=Litorivivens lipolytica TaxID=1524264 RepID=A0A7W4W475_9GAMM|nr:lipoprotein insertase outer membrane protein LolB [Litorivivens lipolytica]MBB3047141.1 outer membrane lipoprotein LolB [Litorivivens lipolytica]
MKPLLLLVAATVLAACSTTPDSQPTDTDSAHWSVSGKVGIWANGERETANFDWQNCAQRYRIRLSGPLGMGAAIIEGNDQEVSLQRGGEATVYADTPEELLAALGWIMPVSALRYWLHGDPDPRAPSRQLTSSNNYPSLEQHGWLVEYAAGDLLPTKVNMTHHSARLKWLLRDWQTFETCPLS